MDTPNKRRMRRALSLRNYSIPVIGALSMMIVTTIVLGGFGIYTYLSESKEQKEMLYKKLETTTDQLSAGLTIPVWNIDHTQINKIIENTMHDLSISEIRVYAAGEVFARHRSPSGEILRSEAPDTARELLLKESRTIAYAGEEIGTIEVFITPKLAEAATKERGISFALLVLLVDFTLLICLNFVLWKTVLKPLRQIERYALEVSSGSKGTGQLQRTPFHGELEILRNSIEKMVTLLEDRITTIKISEVRLYKAKEKAESADRIKSEFLNIAAHELKTPLTPLTALLQMARKQYDDKQPIVPEIWNRLADQVARLSTLVSDLLDVSRLESGNFPVNPRKFELNELIARCVQDFRDQAKQRKITFERSVIPLEIEADPTRIYEVVANLIDNAIKYTPTHSPIEAKILPLPENKVRVSITDHGQGISPAEREAMFTRFFRVTSDATIKHSGLGLGLYICRRILETHKGTIAVESELGKGSTFYFELPRKVA